MPSSALAERAAPPAQDFFREIREGLAAGVLAPYLGPGVLAACGSSLPSTHAELAERLGKKVTLPRRARGNVWAAAQYIESQKHRSVLVRLMDEAFAADAAPSALHEKLASLALPLIVDTWFDSTMRAALNAVTSEWVELQGVSRASVTENRWVRVYAPDGAELPLVSADGPRTLLYKPNGAAAPARNFIISDADCVEVLTEIDIQSPIPAPVQTRRTTLGFVFLGCRFDEQTLRIYARQIVKRSLGPHYAIVDPLASLSRNEERFYAELGVKLLTHPWSDAFAALAL
ncbi:MAG TPA: SIR2 family protein [Polyangiales bacterium]